MRRALAVFLVFAAVVVGCGSDDESSTATPSSEVDDSRIEVLYDGASCTSTGPTELSAGEHSFVITNTTDDASIAMYVRHLVDGHTYQDLLDRQAEVGGPGTYHPRPAWAATTPQVTPGEVLSEHSYRYDHLVEPGVYALVVGNSGEVWFCGGFNVVEV